jgi:hypothetical protein
VRADCGKHTAIASVASNAQEMRICFSHSKSFRSLSIGRHARADIARIHRHAGSPVSLKAKRDTSKE